MMISARNTYGIYSDYRSARYGSMELLLVLIGLGITVEILDLRWTWTRRPREQLSEVVREVVGHLNRLYL